MSRMIRSTVAGIALSLTLGTAAVSARPADRPAVREPVSARVAGPAGIAERVWLLWNALLERVAPAGRQGHGGLSALWANEGSQMDPNGVFAAFVPATPTPTSGF